MTTKTLDSRAMSDVWKWKEEIYQEFRDLPVDKMIFEISKKAEMYCEQISNKKNTIVDNNKNQHSVF